MFTMSLGDNARGRVLGCPAWSACSYRVVMERAESDNLALAGPIMRAGA